MTSIYALDGVGLCLDFMFSIRTYLTIWGFIREDIPVYQLKAGCELGLPWPWN